MVRRRMLLARRSLQDGTTILTNEFGVRHGEPGCRNSTHGHARRLTPSPENPPSFAIVRTKQPIFFPRWSTRPNFLSRRKTCNKRSFVVDSRAKGRPLTFPVSMASLNRSTGSNHGKRRSPNVQSILLCRRWRLALVLANRRVDAESKPL